MNSLKFKSNRQDLENLSFISSEELVGFKMLSVSLGTTSKTSKPRNVGVCFRSISFIFRNAGMTTKT